MFVAIVTLIFIRRKNENPKSAEQTCYRVQIYNGYKNTHSPVPRPTRYLIIKKKKGLNSKVANQ